MIVREIISRRSVRDFKPDPVDNKLIDKIILAAQLAPTAMNNKSVEFIVVKDQQTKNEIFEVVGQEFVKEAPVLIMPAIDIQKSVLPVQDIALATQNIFLQATAEGLGTVWKNLTDQWAKRVKEILGVPKNYLLINIIPLGYPLKPMPPHTESEFDVRKIHFDKW